MRYLAIIAWAIACRALAAGELWLAPGKSVTVLDVAEPAARLVITAPAEAPLDLTPLLELKRGESIHSIATRLQLHGASALALRADGAVALTAGPAATPRGTLLEGGVLVRDGEKWVLHRVAAPRLPPALEAGFPLGRARISKPGATSEQASRDIQHCRLYAERAAAPFLRSQEKVLAYNGALESCLRGFGYTLQLPSA
jgi:hypothetical protein